MKTNLNNLTIRAIANILSYAGHELRLEDRGNSIQKPAGQATPKELENEHYDKFITRFGGLTVLIENPIGSYRRGYDDQGNVTWETKMTCPYGEICSTMGVDGDAVDVYLGPDVNSKLVVVIHQGCHNDWDKFDEDKVMLGFSTVEEAKEAYLAHYDDPRFLMSYTEMDLATFKSKLVNCPAVMIANVIKAYGLNVASQDYLMRDQLRHLVFAVADIELGRPHKQIPNCIAEVTTWLTDKNDKLQMDDKIILFGGSLDGGKSITVKDGWGRDKFLHMVIERNGRIIVDSFTKRFEVTLYDPANKSYKAMRTMDDHTPIFSGVSGLEVTIKEFFDLVAETKEKIR